MSTSRLNRSGPLTIKRSTLNTSGSSIISILEKVGVSSTSDVSISASLSTLNTYSGNSLLDSSNDNKIGIGLASKGSDTQIKFSNFYGANYISGSIKEVGTNNGVWRFSVYPDSVVYNSNYFTEQTSSRAYRYTVYSKPTDLSSGFTKDFSYVKTDVSDEYISSFLDSRIYNAVVKDAVSNAYTSSYFTGSCAGSSYVVTGITDIFQSLNQENFKACINLVNLQVDQSSIGFLRQTDLRNILGILPTLIDTPSTYTLSNKSRTQEVPWQGGGKRTYTFQGFIAKLSDGGRYFSGLCTATGGSGVNPFSYSIDECKTSIENSQLTIYALSSATGVSCTAGTNYSLSNFAVSPSCDTPAQPTSTPTSVLDLRLTGSVLFSNSSNNPDAMLITPNNDWVDLNNNRNLLLGDALLRPTFEQTSYTLQPGESVRVGFGFGVNLYNSTLQSSSINAMGTFTAKFPPTPPHTQEYTGYIHANMDKHTCLSERPNSGILPT